MKYAIGRISAFLGGATEPVVAVICGLSVAWRLIVCCAVFGER
jgi:hypothetical protein